MESTCPQRNRSRKQNARQRAHPRPSIKQAEKAPHAAIRASSSEIILEELRKDIEGRKEERQEAKRQWTIIEVTKRTFE